MTFYLDPFPRPTHPTACSPAASIQRNPYPRSSPSSSSNGPPCLSPSLRHNVASYSCGKVRRELCSHPNVLSVLAPKAAPPTPLVFLDELRGPARCARIRIEVECTGAGGWVESFAGSEVKWTGRDLRDDLRATRRSQSAGTELGDHSPCSAVAKGLTRTASWAPSRRTSIRNTPFDFSLPSFAHPSPPKALHSQNGDGCLSADYGGKEGVTGGLDEMDRIKSKEDIDLVACRGDVSRSTTEWKAVRLLGAHPRRFEIPTRSPGSPARLYHQFTAKDGSLSCSKMNGPAL